METQLTFWDGFNIHCTGKIWFWRSITREALCFCSWSVVVIVVVAFEVILASNCLLATFCRRWCISRKLLSSSRNAWTRWKCPTLIICQSGFFKGQDTKLKAPTFLCRCLSYIKALLLIGCWFFLKQGSLVRSAVALFYLFVFCPFHINVWLQMHYWTIFS